MTWKDWIGLDDLNTFFNMELFIAIAMAVAMAMAMVVGINSTIIFPTDSRRRLEKRYVVSCFDYDV